LSSALKATALASALLIAGASQGFAQAATKLVSNSSSATTSNRSADEKASLTGAATASTDCCKAKSLPDAAWDALSQDILSERESHRASAVAALATIGPRDDVVALLKEALQDKQPLVRKNAASALGDMQARSAAAELRRLLDDPSPDVSFAAASALWKMEDRSGRNLLIATLSGTRKGDGAIKSEMKNTVQRYRDPKQLAIMGAREAAGTFLGPASMGIGVAQELMKDHGASARAACATLLGKDPSPEAVHELTLALADKNWAVRSAAAQALTKTSGQVSPEVFEPLLIDDNISVRDMAAAGIIRTSHAPRPKNLRWPVPPDAAAATSERAASQ
jgi:HEAT repeat protein